jgi:hypothetical protein
MSGDVLLSKTAIGAVTPTNAQGFTCGNGDGGTRPLDCLAILGSYVTPKFEIYKLTNEASSTANSSVTQTPALSSAPTIPRASKRANPALVTAT